MNTPTTTIIYEDVYGFLRNGGSLEHDMEELESKRLQEPGGLKRPSVYVDCFEKMVDTVYRHERHLISDQELDILDAFSRLCYNARYCLVRLLLRKPDTWHTLASMDSYTKEVGEEGLAHAMDDLCQPVDVILNPEAPHEEVVKEEEPEFIDLTCFSDDKGEGKRGCISAETGSSKFSQSDDFIGSSEYGVDIKPTLESLERPGWDSNFDFFCEDDTSMTLEDVLGKLKVDQLKTLVKDAKVKLHRHNKTEMITALLKHASTQSILRFAPIGSSQRMRRSGRFRRTVSSVFSYGGKTRPSWQSQEERLMQMALKMLGKSYRLNIDLYWLVVRFNVIYERSMEYPKSLLIPSLLTSFKKRTYPDYKYNRDSGIWATREGLLDYVEALRLEAAIEQELELPPPGKSGTKTPVPGNNRSHSVISGARSITTKIAEALNLGGEAPTTEEVEDVPIQVQKARNVKRVFDEKVFPRWKDRITSKKEPGIWPRTPGLERFESGFVYTRIFSKAMSALATLKAYKEEAMALDALLGQKRWRRGKRAVWYERRAILQTRYLCSVEGQGGKEKDLVVLRQAMEGVREALEDEDTGLVFRPSLVRRLRALEKKLKVPQDERCQCEGELRKANSVSFSAVRLYATEGSPKLDANGRPVNNGDSPGVRAYFPLITATVKGDGERLADKESKPDARSSSKDWRWKGKSLWKGNNGEEVNVETCALQYYENQGYKGFHSESRILTTIFALLFWDIIFADVRGAFETPHQLAPLDIYEDSFYRARRDAIEVLLEEIKQKGRASEIIADNDTKHREKKTCCIGVHWDICDRQDILEIVECLSGESLSIICRLFCEDYRGRCSGVPDLIVWNVDRCSCKFVEVKGPGDRPQENQKLWFDSLLGACVDVEICNVLDVNQCYNIKPKKYKGEKVKGLSLKRGDSDNAEMAPLEREEGADYSEHNDHGDSLPQQEYATRHKVQGSGTKRRWTLGEDKDELSAPTASLSVFATPVGSHVPPLKRQKVVMVESYTSFSGQVMDHC